MKKINTTSILAHGIVIAIKAIAAFTALSLTMYAYWVICGMLPQGPNFGVFLGQMFLVTIPMFIIGIVVYAFVFEGIVRGVITIGELLSKNDDENKEWV